MVTKWRREEQRNNLGLGDEHAGAGPHLAELALTGQVIGHGRSLQLRFRLIAKQQHDDKTSRKHNWRIQQIENLKCVNANSRWRSSDRTLRPWANLRTRKLCNSSFNRINAITKKKKGSQLLFFPQREREPRVPWDLSDFRRIDCEGVWWSSVGAGGDWEQEEEEEQLKPNPSHQYSVRFPISRRERKSQSIEFCW